MTFDPELSVTMFVADAARHATPEQRARLKSEALPSLKDKAYLEVLNTTIDIMGPDWDLEPETKAHLLVIFLSGDDVL